MTNLDLTPAEPKRSGFRSTRNIAIGVAFACLAGFIGVQAIASARVFFLNVDEAIDQRDDLDGKTIRMQGFVLTEPDPESTDYRFALGFNDSQAVVDHIGVEPTELFECGQNVVVEGTWEGDEFSSTQILVKHSEEYLIENADRIVSDKGNCSETTDLESSVAEKLGV